MGSPWRAGGAGELGAGLPGKAGCVKQAPASACSALCATPCRSWCDSGVLRHPDQGMSSAAAASRRGGTTCEQQQQHRREGRHEAAPAQHAQTRQWHAHPRRSCMWLYSMAFFCLLNTDTARSNLAKNERRQTAVLIIRYLDKPFIYYMQFQKHIECLTELHLVARLARQLHRKLTQLRFRFDRFISTPAMLFCLQAHVGHV